LIFLFIGVLIKNPKIKISAGDAAGKNQMETTKSDNLFHIIKVFKIMVYNSENGNFRN